MINQQDIIDSLRLINASRVGPVAYYEMVEYYGCESEALAALNATERVLWSEERAIEEIEQCQKSDITLLFYKDAAYPQILKLLPDYPPILYVKGQLEALNFARSVAIVGARSASINGCSLASRIAQDLSANNICVISGMARGIDAAAHLGAMSAHSGCGSTIAVLGTGVDVIYPPENASIYQEIAVNGCIISQFPLKTQGNASNFPRRNQIIAGLSQGVLVVEAGLKSGSLITADFAMKQNKPVFAIPGNPDAVNSSGSNYLIKKGAVLTENATDILPFIKASSTQNIPQFSKPKQKVLVFANNDVKFSNNESYGSSLVDFITVDGVDIDELARVTGKNTAQLAAEILELELNGIVQRRSGNRVALLK